ncbi:MAG: TolC family protein [Cyanobacteria bacterium P01_G01_bin.54]
MPKVRSLIVASTGAVVALGYQGSAIAQQAPFPFTAANPTASAPASQARPSSTLPPFPEVSATDASAANGGSLPPFPEATGSTPPPPNAAPVTVRDSVLVPNPNTEPTAAPLPTAIRPQPSAPTTYPDTPETAPSQISPNPVRLAAIAPNEIHPHLLNNVAKTTKVEIATASAPESLTANSLNAAEPIAPGTGQNTIAARPTNPIAQTFQVAHAPHVATQAAKSPKPSQELAASQTPVIATAETTPRPNPLAKPPREILVQANPVTVETRVGTENGIADAGEPEMDELEVGHTTLAEENFELPTPNGVASTVEAAPLDSAALETGPETPPTELIIEGEVSPNPEPATTDQFKDPKNAQALTAAPAPGERQEVPPPDFLNPSGNPLLFPTEADEVAIDITQPITLVQALALARRNNQDLQSARLNLERAYAVLNEARAGLFPTVDGTVSLTRENSASTEISISRQGALSGALGTDATTDTLNAELAVTYNLLDGGQVNAEINSAKLSLRFTQLELEELTEEIHLSATQAYYALQEADQQVGIELAAVEQAQQTRRDASLLLDAGLGTRFDVIRADVDLANSQQALTQARADQKIARRDLVRVLGLGQQVEVTTADEIRPVEPWNLSLEETIVLAYRNRAELEQRLIEREIEEEERQIALSTRRPQLSLFANYNVLDFLDDDFDGSSGYSVGAQLQWNFFDGGASQARKRQSEVDLELAEVAFEQERNVIRLEVEEAYFSFEANEANIKTAIAARDLAEESLRLARLRFQAGVGTQTDVIDAQTELTEARGNLLTAIITYNNSIASLRRAVSNTPDRRLFDLP